MLKLYVVGSSSSNPADWSQEPDGIAFVIAADEADARSQVEEDAACPVREIPMTAPMVLGSMASDAMQDAMA